MNTSRLKAFAPAVRRDLMEAVDRRLGVVLAAQSPDLRTTYAPQVAALTELARIDRAGLVERVAYTWFNRLAALRYLDAWGWHPFRARVLTSAGEEATQPELLKVVREGALPPELARHTDPARLNDLLDGRLPSTDPQGEVYRHLVLASCRFYHALLPSLFERLDDATELLLPDDVLTEHSVAEGFRTEITDADCAGVELLGWLYQFYISERKDEVMARKSAVPTADIPAVTQIFTPHWIVRYLIENSLGRLWLLNRPHSRLRNQMPYYIEGEAETDFPKIASPEDIRLCDPAAGSGHMLTYAYDVLTLIYEEEGYATTDIPALILRHNLVGIEICPRAAQLAELALVFKARERSPRFFQPEHLTRPRITELRDVHFAAEELREYVKALNLGELFEQPVHNLLSQFEAARTFGSLIRPCLDKRAIMSIRRAIEAKDLGGQLFLSETHLKVIRVLEQAEVLSQQYHVVIANPPYMGSGAMNAQLKAFVEDQLEDGKADTYAAFMLRSQSLALRSGHVAMITIPNWMFLKSFERLREHLLENCVLTNLVHCGRGVWGSDFGSCAFVFQVATGLDRVGVFKRLFRKQGEVQTNEELAGNFADVENFPTYLAQASTFRKIAGSPIAYWIKGLHNFSQRKIGDLFVSGGRNKTHDNEKYLRFSWEVSRADARWIVYANGGDFRKFYGNELNVVDWSDSARAIYDSHGGLCNKEYWGKEGITWSLITAATPSFRIKRAFAQYSSGAPTIFGRDFVCDLPALAFLNSVVAIYYLRALNPTVNTTVNDILSLPFLPLPSDAQSALEQRTAECMELAKVSWDNCEISWDFRDQPLLRPGLKGATLEASWRNWEAQSTADIRRMQELETENNRLFIAAYGLEGELHPEVPDEQITLARAEVRRDIAIFLSYAVGCMMGRYSPDHPGLVLANAGDTLSEFLAKVGRSQEELTFAPDEDGIIPVLDGEWFEDDIVARTRDFLRATFGEATLRDNLRFIEDSIGKDLRKYFLTDFYKDHLQTYKKRPIYWLVQSPKKGFGALVYLHRYTRDTLNVVLNRYLREYQDKLRNRLTHLSQVLADEALPARDRTTARKEAERLTKTLHECQEWEREALLPLAQQRIPLDLDDGVKVNYLKLADVLAPIPGLAAAEE